MKVLIFDTETTGLALWKEPSGDPGQPHVVDLAAELWDGDQLLEEYSSLVAIGVPIPADMTAIHGIDDAMAAGGSAPGEVWLRFLELTKRADVIAGHNVSFDVRMMRIMGARVTGEKWEPMQPTFCTMRKSVGIVRAPKKNARFANDWKLPSLGEAVRHFFGEEHPNAHRAKPDCVAARRVYFALQRIGGLDT